MRVTRLGLACLGLALLVAALQARELHVLWSTPKPLQLRDGDPAPPLRFRTKDGKEQDLAALQGSPVVVTFWASWCVPCRAELPELANVVKELNAEPGVPAIRVLAINTSDEPREAERVMRDPTYADFTFHIDDDGRLAEAWGARALPTMVLVRPDGKIESARIGYHSYMSQHLRSWVRSVRKGTP